MNQPEYKLLLENWRSYLENGEQSPEILEEFIDLKSLVAASLLSLIHI